MVRKVVLAVAALGLFSGAANGVFSRDAYGAQRYLSYRSCRPSYLAGPCVVSAQPCLPQVSASQAPEPRVSASQAPGPQVFTAYYPPAQDTAVPAQPISEPSRTYQGGNGNSYIGPVYGKARSSMGSVAISANAESGPFYDHAGSSFDSDIDTSHFLGY
jgi:hypothetical protein